MEESDPKIFLEQLNKEKEIIEKYIKQLEESIIDNETKYLQSTVNGGNVLRGWEHIFTSKSNKIHMGNQIKKTHISNNEKLFSQTFDFDKINERSKVDINDILFAMIGTIGNPVLITKEPDFAIKNVALFKDKRCTNQAYLKFYLSSSLALNRMLDDAKGSNQKFIPLSYFRSFLVPLPPTIKEQQRIANALSDVDTLIANLEKLIAKKKNIKQGAMQQLLTGRKRLPGFELFLFFLRNFLLLLCVDLFVFPFTLLILFILLIFKLLFILIFLLLFSSNFKLLLLLLILTL